MKNGKGENGPEVVGSSNLFLGAFIVNIDGDGRELDVGRKRLRC